MSVMVMRTPAQSGILVENRRGKIGFGLIFSQHNRYTVGESVKPYVIIFDGQAVRLLPAHREKVESDCTTDDLLHV